MSYQVLARKYRPATFDEVLGQEGPVRTLQNAVREDRVAHAYIFSGTRGVGKTTVARLLAKALNCESGPTPDPCGTCTPCREIAEGHCLDVLEIDAASNTGVDNVRELRESIPYAPSRDRFKVFIIDEAHMLSSAAWNALLKTLEEPPPHVKFIFATTEPNKILDTITSRSQHFDFRTLPREALKGHLEQVARAEDLTPGPGVLELVTRAAAGSVRDALSTLDQIISFAGPEATEDEARMVLGLVAEETLDQFLQAVADRDAGAALAVVGELAGAGQEFRLFCGELLEQMRLIVLGHTLKDPAGALELDPQEADRLETLRGRFNLDEAVRLFGLLEDVDRDLRRTTRERHLFEVAAVRMTRLMGLTPLEELVGRLLDSPGDTVPGGSGPEPPPARPAARSTSPGRPPRKGGRTTSAAIASSDTGEPEPLPPPAGDHSPEGDLAGRLQVAVGRRKANLGAYLTHAREVRVDGESLTVIFPASQELWARRLNKPEALQILREAAREVAEQPLEPAVRVEEAQGDNPARERPADKRRRLIDQALDDPLVRHTVDRFRARVVDARETHEPETP
jgi:DNA polymerase-3 subunit gamma/tau